MELAEKYLVRLNAQYLTAVSRNETEQNQMIVWFNNQPLHTAPLAMNLLHNAMARAVLGNDHSIRVVNKPLPFTLDSRITMLLTAGNNIGFQLATNVSFAMAFVSAFYILFYIKVINYILHFIIRYTYFELVFYFMFLLKERESKAKLLQFVSGLNVSTFWITSFIWDYVTFVLTSILLLITLALFREEGWSNIDDLMRVFVVLLLFGFAMLPLTFVASMFFSVPSSGFVRMTIIYIFTGMFFSFDVL